jgi:hypothetical protein
MKYEMIFGDEALFDGAPDDAEYAGWFCQETRWYMILNGKILFSDGGSWCTSDNPYLSADIAAMRRIIKEPKRWTWEDKKAGVLPEVGAECIKEGKVVTIINVNERYVTYIDKNNSRASSGNVSINFVNSFLKPIETPDEKAQREEDEFYLDVKNDWNLAMSNKDESFELGVRAAYRKLKGGE